MRKTWIQTQHLDEKGTSLGGLYIDLDEVCAVHAVDLGNGKFQTFITLKSGIQFKTVHSVSDWLDELNKPKG